MAATLEAHASRPDIERYHELLKSDFSKDTLRSVLSLLWKLIAKSVQPKTYPWQKVLEFPPRAGTDINLEIAQTIHQVARSFHDNHLPPLKISFTKLRPDASLIEAQQVWTYLCLPTLGYVKDPARNDSSVAFFHDLLSLLYLCSLETVLPALDEQGIKPARDFLLNAHFVHTVAVWNYNPSHQYYLQSLLMDYLDQHELALYLRHLSLRLTDVEDHSYLTKAQAIWSDLIDLGRARDAYSFLLDLAKSTPKAYRAELEEMTVLTAKELANGSKKR